MIFQDPSREPESAGVEDIVSRCEHGLISDGAEAEEPGR